MRQLRNIACFALLGLAFVGYHQAYADNASATNTNLVPANTIITNLNQTLNNLQKQTSLPIRFPTEIPAPTDASVKNYYLSTQVDPNGKQYTINIDRTADCNGARYCNIGSISARQNGKPQKIKSFPDNKLLTQRIDLDNSLKGFYTPSHNAADFWPTMLEWRQTKVLYNITWAIKDNEQQTITTMANNIIDASNSMGS